MFYSILKKRSTGATCAQILYTAEIEQLTKLSETEKSVRAVVAHRATSAEGTSISTPNNEELEESFRRVEERMGVHGLSSIVRMFVEAQCRNLELFMEVSGLNDEIARLKGLIEATEADIEVSFIQQQ